MRGITLAGTLSIVRAEEFTKEPKKKLRGDNETPDFYRGCFKGAVSGDI